ncbi:histidine phosphatase family protein [Ligilactobacillus apodemi]|uniref:Phosphoglycerate mutase n=1 Tax=Ligilactobacillus apodemi DSM 16634 = JCM 16172 TaxID=1423724 RepID=A0A0R1U7X9_9LACO|nr:histidine phosphatase family protein [Ligilactobacillus apodemi]KRL87320.1 phosphoglycerate mutase [Ligilactobacillus apodemi DSM 16634 = JCM 16172]MCR1901750.1 histidine phosphatase family protein [Ligilactobacillus apodemi]
MEQTLYLMRHGQTLFNSLGKIEGWSDSPLTLKGIAQAKDASKYFKDVDLSAAYCSASERCCDTLRHLTTLPYMRLKGLKEQNFGILEGEHDYLQHLRPYGELFVKYGGESDQAVQERMVQTCTEIMQKSSGRTVLAVTHANACLQFLKRWSPTEEVTSVPNGCIFKYDFNKEDNSFKLLEKIELAV